MKALVLSDSHGYSKNFFRALEAEKDCNLVFFLGDGFRDFEQVKQSFPNRSFVAVCGNNDFSCNLEDFAYKHIEGNTIIACHGHTISVKRSLLPLLEKAQSVRANIALYGHTHRSDCFYDSYSGIYAINPGALCNGNYAVLNLEKGNFDVKFKNVYEVK